jgi:hypothetical protein
MSTLDEPEFEPRPSPWTRRTFKWSDEELAYWRALDDFEAGFNARHTEDVRYIARAVALPMYVFEKPEFADEFLARMTVELPHATSYLLDIVREARRMYAEWMDAGEITDQFITDEIYGEVYGDDYGEGAEVE